MDLKTIGEKVCKGIATQEEENYIKDMYRKVLGVAFSACKCQLCDAYFLILKRQKTMSRFKLRKGICLRIKYGDPRFIKASNLTDELAIEHLTNNPSEAKYYDFIPEDFMAKKVEKPIEVVKPVEIIKEVIEHKPLFEIMVTDKVVEVEKPEPIKPKQTRNRRKRK